MKLRNKTCIDTFMILTNLTLLRRYIFKTFHENEKNVTEYTLLNVMYKNMMCHIVLECAVLRQI
jgi:hypothetical protein